MAQTRTRTPVLPRDAQRRQIVAAVRALHAAGGYDAVTMRAVADAIGMAPMSLYRYFASKAALLEGAWGDALGQALEAARAPLDDQNDPYARLRSYYSGYIGYWLAQPNAYWMIFDIRGVPPNWAFFDAGPAADFRAEAQALVDACLGAGATKAVRLLAHDLCRCKVVGFLYLAVALNRGRGDLAGVRDALLDDIECQLRGMRNAPRRAGRRR